MGFKFEKAFGVPVKVINDAAMQALGSYKKGRMLFLGLGTGLGSTMIVDGEVNRWSWPTFLTRRQRTRTTLACADSSGWGRKKWQRCVCVVVARLAAALEPDDIVLGGGNVKKLRELPPGCRVGNNANAFLGGFRLWGQTGLSIFMAKSPQLFSPHVLQWRWEHSLQSEKRKKKKRSSKKVKKTGNAR